MPTSRRERFAMFTISDDLRKIADKVISERKDLAGPAMPECRIAYLYSDQEKKSSGRKVYADTEKVGDKAKTLMPFDFIITFYQPNCAALPPEKMELLMYHELRHVGFDLDGKCRIIPHDVEDFSDILEEHGMRWII